MLSVKPKARLITLTEYACLELIISRGHLLDVQILHTVRTHVKVSLTSCSKSANKLSTSCVRTACPKLSTSLEQTVNNL